MTATLAPGLPRATAALLSGPADRWRPARVGALRVWQYANEVVEFASGRLLLLGANGSGKTMLLELTLPYLLDTDATGGRLSTSTARDRGGLWQRVTGYADEGRTGYLWIQFTRTVTDGTGDGRRDEHFTIGTRLQAHPGGNGTHCWFTTTQQPGVDLYLLDDDQIPLSVAALTEAIGDHGHVWKDDTDGYRDAVRTTLFAGFTYVQMQALLNTLLTVRKQSVTDGLTQPELNTLLSDGLPALDETEIRKIAAGFEDLDSRRDQIASMSTDLTVVGALHDAVSRYARAIIGRQAARVRRAHNEARKVTQRETKATATQKQAAATREQLTEDDQAAERREAEIAGEIAGLQNSEAFAHSGDLRALAETAKVAEELAAVAKVAADEAAENLADVHGRVNTEQGELEGAVTEHRDAVATLRRLTRDARIVDAVEQIDDDELHTAVRLPARAQLNAIKDVRAAVTEHGGALTNLANAAAQLEDANVGLGEANDAEASARNAADQAMASYRTALRQWLSTLRTLHAAELAGLPAVDDPADVATEVAAATAAVREHAAQERQQLTGSQEVLTAEVDVLRTERDELDAGTFPRPDPPAWRRGRDARDGAPLWQLVDFSDSLDATGRDQLESALRAAGLLDAFVTVDGNVELDGEVADTTLTASGTAAGGVRTLADVLVTEPQDTVPADTVRHILTRIELVDADAYTRPVAVGLDRSFRLGALTGRGHLGAAELIGASAQAASRRRRMAAIDVRLDELAQSIAALDEQLAAVAARVVAAVTEAANLPSAVAVTESRQQLSEARGGVEQATRALATWEGKYRTAEAAVAVTARKLATAADKYRLPKTVDELDVVADAIRQVEAAADACKKAWRERGRAAARVRDLQGQHDRLAGPAAAKERAARKAANDAAARAAEYSARQAAVGTEASQVDAQLATLTGELETVKGERSRLRRDTETAIRTLAEADAALGRVVEERQKADVEREAARVAFMSTVTSTLFDDADLDVTLPDTMHWTAVLNLVTDVNPQLAGTATDTGTINTLRRDAGERFHTATGQLAGRFDLAYASEVGHDWDVMVAREEGVVLSCTALKKLVARRLEDARAELTRSEQRVFEQTLTGAVRSHLADRIRTARDLVDQMNNVLASVRTDAGGVGVQLRWELDGDVADRATLTQIRDLLLAGHHSPAETDQLHQFLRDQIERVRADDGGAASWQQRLTAILDYRSWHRFTVIIHHDRFGDRPMPFTSRKVSLSAGEKTVALTLPLIAAVAAHYMPRDGQDVPACPRLLLMDELFPKVDRANKQKLLGLLPVLDLDAVFTSDKDWCNYSTLDAIAVHVVQKTDDISYTTRFVWNGSRQLDAPVAVPSSGRDTAADELAFDG